MPGLRVIVIPKAARLFPILRPKSRCPCLCTRICSRPMHRVLAYYDGRAKNREREEDRGIPRHSPKMVAKKFAKRLPRWTRPRNADRRASLLRGSLLAALPNPRRWDNKQPSQIFRPWRTRVARSVRPRQVIAIPTSIDEARSDGQRTLFGRVLRRLRHIDVEIQVLRKWRRLNYGINRARKPPGRPTFPRSLIIALLASQREAASEMRASGYEQQARLDQKTRGVADDFLVQRDRHEFTAEHGPGQLQMLLVLGYCRRHGQLT